MMQDRSCGNLTQCNVMQYVSVPATFSTDRECATLAVCDSVVSGDPRDIETVANVSSLTSAVEVGAAESEAIGDEADPETMYTVSSPQSRTTPVPSLTNANPGTTTATGRSYSIEPTRAAERAATEYEMQRPTASSNRECALLTECAESRDEYELAAPTASSNRICRQRSVCDVVLRPELERPPPGAETVEVFPGSPTHDRVCLPLSALCDFESEYLHHVSINYDTFALGAMRSSWNDWADIFDSSNYGEEEVLAAVSYDTARSYGMWDALFNEVDVNGDQVLDRQERDHFRAQNLTGPNAMGTGSTAAVEEGYHT